MKFNNNDDDRFVSDLPKGAMHVSHGKDDRFWGDRGAGILLIAKDTGRILLVLRSQEVNEPGTWGMPGGKIDSESESPASAAKREAHEEVGFSGGMELIPAHVFKSGTFSFHNFFGVIDSEFEPRLDWENDDARWVTLDGLPNNLHFGVKSLLSNSGNELKKIIDNNKDNIVKETRKIKNIINILLEKEIVANKFNRPEYQPTKRIDEPEGGLLGNVLFSSERIDGVDTTEPNTPDEDIIYRSLVRHVDGNQDDDLKRSIHIILDLIGQGKYDLLKPMDGYVYRAMTFNAFQEDVFSDFGFTLEDIKNNATNKPWIFEPDNLILKSLEHKEGFMSWTYNLSEFALGGMSSIREGGVLIIFRASVPDSGTFVFNPLLTNKVNSLKYYAKERETISYGGVKVNKMLVYHQSRDSNQSTKEMLNKIKNILKVISNIHLKDLNKIIDSAEQEMINYINEQVEFVDGPLKNISELSNKYRINDLYSLKSFFTELNISDDMVEDLIENIYAIIIDKSNEATNLAYDYRKRTETLFAKQIPVLQRYIIKESLEENKFFSYSKLNIPIYDIKWNDGLKTTFLGFEPERKLQNNIKNVALGIMASDVDYEDRRTELNNTRNMLFRIFQNES